MIYSAPNPPPLPDENPFAAPNLATSSPLNVDDAEATSLCGARKALMKTRPWVLGIAVVGFILSALMLVGTLSNVYFLRFGEIGLFQTVFFAAMPLVLGGLTFALSLLLGFYAARIKRFRDRPTHDTLHRALEAQTAFWRLAGIALIASLALYLALIVAITTDLATHRWETSDGVTTEVKIETSSPSDAKSK